MEHEAPWDEIARAWQDGAITIAQIADQYGLTRVQLSRAAKERGWPTRAKIRSARASSGTRKAAAKRSPVKTAAAPRKTSKAAGGEAGQGASPAKAAKPRTKSVNAKTLVNRIYSTIDKELSKLEQHDGESSQDRERASRALSQMVNSLEKAVDMQREITKAQGRAQASGKDKEALKHAEELRREIADRLERLQRKRTAAG